MAQQTEPELRQLRVDIDAAIKKVEAFNGSRELSLVKTKLEEAKMWAGKELGNIGVELPKAYQDAVQLDEQAEQAVGDRNGEVAPNTPSADPTTPTVQPEEAAKEIPVTEEN